MNNVKHWTLIAGLTLTLLPPVMAQSTTAVTNPAAKTVSITVEGCDLESVVTMFQRLTGASLQYRDREFMSAQRVTFSCNDRPWRPALQALLAEQGFVLLSQPDDVYSIMKVDSPSVAVHVRHAQDAVAIVEAALADIRTNNVASATTRLQAYADEQRKVLMSVQAAPAIGK